MSSLRNRAQEHFPAVLLTLISIIQALALELLWGKITDNGQLWPLDPDAVVAWGMVSVTFLGILQIWIMYSSLVMCFVWLPGLRDSIFPFIIGVQEFLLIGLITTGHTGLWLVVLASIFVTANIISHLSMRRARREPANQLFFRNIEPATWRDFRWPGLIVGMLTVMGVLTAEFESVSLIPLLAMTVANVVLIIQIIGSWRLWQTIMTLEED